MTRRSLSCALLAASLLSFTGCGKLKKAPSLDFQTKSSPDQSLPVSAPGTFTSDACGLITKDEIEAVQGSVIGDTKSSGNSDGAFRVAQCYYAAAESNRSVSLAVTQRSGPDTRNPKDFWQETFGRFTGTGKELEGDKEKRESLREHEGEKGEHEASPPKKIDGIGDAAYWVGDRVGGALYVLKNDTFIRVSLGGPDKEEIKIDKSKTLASKALARL